MAGAGYKLFTTGSVLTASDVNTYLNEQTVMVFANAAARTTALSGVLAEGMVTYLKDTDALEIYSGSAWVGYGSGDITGITTGATSGLTGGVTSGTADLKFNTTAKGGLLVGTGSGTVSELAVGSNTQVLTADSTTATGLKWAAASSGTPAFVGCMAVANANQSLTTDVLTVINFGGTDLWDTDGFHDPSTNNSRITIPSGKAGYYQFEFDIRFAANANGVRELFLGINGVTGANLFRGIPGNSRGTCLTGAFTLNLAVGDYVTIIAYQTSGGSLNLEWDNSTNQRDAGLRFGCRYLGA